MADHLSKRPEDIAKMSDEAFMQWLDQVHRDVEEHPDRKGPIQYIVEDTMRAGESIGQKINETIEEYRLMRKAQQEADRAERQAERMRQRLLQRKQELGQ